MKHARNDSKNNVAVPVAIVVVLCIAAVMIAVSLSRIGGDDPAVTDTNTSETTTVTTAPNETAETTAPDTSAADETEPPVSETDAPGTEYNEPADRDTDFSGCLFIGDSRTEGLMLYSGISGAKAYTARGLMVDTYFTSPVVDLNGKKVTVAEAVESGGGYDRVYVMLGINELGWPYENVFGDCYGRLIDHLKATLPGAEINVQSIIPVTKAKSDGDAVYNNTKIEQFNEVIRGVCAEKGVNYVDLAPGLCGEEGVLPEEAAFDGVHLQKSYCKRWLDLLKERMA